MSISTIGQAMGLYAQPSEFDQNAWKQAFDIANGFAESSEAQRRNRENLATSEWRVAALNAKNQANIAESQNQKTLSDAKQGWWNFIKQNGRDELGRMRTPEELLNLGFTQNINPALLQQLYTNNQQYAQNVAQELAPYNPQSASQYRAMAGLSPFVLDENWNVTNFNSGLGFGQIDDPMKAAQFAAGQVYQSQQQDMKAQAEAAKAQVIAEARYPYQQALIDQRANYSQAKQNEWIKFQQDQTALKNINAAVQNIVSSSGGNKEKANAALSALVTQYPHLKDYIGNQAAIEFKNNEF